MESVFLSIICLMLILSCSYSKPVEKIGNFELGGATDEENVTQAVLSALPNIQKSQGEIMALLNQSLVSSQRHDEQIANLTSTLGALLVNVASLLQDQLNVLKTGAVAELVCPNQYEASTTEPSKTTPEGITDSSTPTPKGITESSQTSPQHIPLPSVTTKIPVLQDCQVLAARAPYPSGSYRISPSDESGSFQVVCDMETDGGGWTIIQKRYDGSLDFNKGWDEYEQGFGDVNGEHWMGLRNIRRLLSQEGSSWVLQIDLESFDSDTAYAEYDSFMIGDAASNYTMSLGSYHGNAGDAIQYDLLNQSSMQFSTHDRDNDLSSLNCAYLTKGGWWYAACAAASLNGQYLGASGYSWKGVVWYNWKEWYSLKRSEMKIRRV